MTRLPGLLAAGLFAAGAVAVSSPARADWPMSRHDPQRTAAAPGKSNITDPAPAWRYPTGGAIYFTQAIVADGDGDGKPEAYFVRGSSAVGKHLGDTTLWHTPSMGIVSVQALADLDGDGKPELVVRVGTGQNAVLDAATGAVDWLEPEGELGFAGTTLIADLNGDGLPEVLVQDCGCCAVVGKIPGAVYTFAGDAKQPKLLWQLPYASCGGAATTTFLDADGDGKLDVLMGRMGAYDLLDGATGQVRATVNVTAQNQQVGQCIPAHLKGQGEQAVCVYSDSTADDSGHRVFAIGFVPGPTPALTVLWDRKIGVSDGGISLQPGLVSDLDGDGQMEVVVGGKTGATTASTYVLDGASGNTLATIDGHTLVGTAPVLAGGRGMILTAESDGFAAWAFTRKPTPSATLRWQLPGQGPLQFRDFALSTRTTPMTSLLALDLTGDGTPDLITADSIDGTLRVLDASQGGAMPPPVAGSMAPPANAGLLWSAPTTLGGQPTLVTGWSDGVFRFHALNNGQLADVAPPGIHFDGYYATSYWRALGPAPVVASLGPGEPDSVLFTDAGGTLHSLDAAKASMDAPPIERWGVPQTSSPVVVPNLNGGKPGVLVIQNQPVITNPRKQQVSALSAEGKPLWVSPFDGTTWTELVTGNFDGDGVADVLVQASSNADGSSTVQSRALSGATGAVIWNGATFSPALPTGAATYPWSGGPLDDILFEDHGLHVLSGTSGGDIGPMPAENAANGMPVVADVDGDGKAEVVIQGGYAWLAVLSPNLTQLLYKSQEVQSTIQYGALARCPDGAKLVESTYFYHTDRLRLTELTAPQTGKETDLFLANGQIFPDEASATAAGVYQGVLTAVSVHENLTGAGHPSALVGSSDGWLYAIDPCTHNLDFAYNFGDAVGSVAFGDTDGDGLDEILVEVSDGYLYDLKQKTPAPGTGGAGGSGGFGGFGGAGGSGGTGGKKGTGGSDGINGRATCFCAMPGDRGGSELGLALALGLAAAASARRRVRRPRG